MKSVILSILFAIIFSNYSIAQNLSAWYKLNEEVVYVNNTDDCWFYFKIPADTIIKSDEFESVFFTKKGETFQILKKPLSLKQNKKKYYAKKEQKLLKEYKEYEINYQEKEVFTKKIKNEEFFFKNKYGKTFLLWYYKNREGLDNRFDIFIDDENEYVKPVLDINFSHQMFLTFISNSYLVSIAVSVPENKLQEKINFCKELADNIFLFGVGLASEELDKIEKNKNEKYIITDDSLSNIKIEVPEWMILQQYPKYKIWPDYILLFAAYPDSCNIVNALAVTVDKKVNYSSFEKFNEFAINSTDYLKVLDSKIQNTHGGISKKVISKSSWGGIFYEHIYTIETNKSYIRINFTATSSTYDYNIKRHKQFLNSIILEE